MIEVEKKFQPTDGQLSRLLVGAQFINEQKHTDIYYDLPDFSYLRKDTHFRKRDDKYELKIKMPVLSKHTSRFEEIDDETDILERLGFDRNAGLEKIIKENMIISCVIKTKRRKYKKDEFIIDIDKTDFGYNVCEIELLVESETEMNQAEEKIIAFAKKFDFPIEKLPGKVKECLRITKPEIYKNL
jgi:adenylate cyclase class IV